ncbi:MULTISPECIES: sigma 54-interacting transcriptional regulator [Desulfococcus]|jgi:PAS domain S-box-containing protein|uniref:PAS modulated sigma54 specific transcriptional regulator, Fis family n=1 Tax=Desulfococcus multivorans DSM 2059 TaxID=1121405 RepID=S7V883_DESML|nr:sigma 54-interacting transcriptional regulator [Desulfococcus multivorans]AOY59438.1 PAS modulated sigma54 specific transcriptinal regulator, Fis family [Desulfococcus multivorans]AQV03041.2 hypothetical protein B2D07_13315 [Desulfococcus multivorans]EPR42859.1 PAS modulated sigma54 specific transcriptional regulator, Fis family [Desulfococcus multivorans DSM 2059]MDX9817687.1 sigma 54-interacting transcriptional regulator [Desulfococcus multivorans]SKA00782.1 PAS domain S-box-containing pr
MKNDNTITIQNLKDLDLLVQQIRRLEQANERPEKKALQQYMSVFDNSGAPAIIIENDMLVSRANPKFEELTGFTKTEIEGRLKWPQFLVEEDRERMVRYHTLRRIREDKAPEEYECTVVTKTGQLKYIYMKVGMIPGTRRSVASFTDITSLKLTEQALRESDRRLSTLMGNLPGMAYRGSNDARRTMTFLSQGCRGLTGLDPAVLTGADAGGYADLIHPDDRKMVLAVIQKAVSQRRAYEMVYRIRLADNDGEKWVWEKGVGVFSPEDELVALEGFITDFTDQKRSEQALVQENIRLRSSMKDRYQFCGIIGKSPAMQQIYEMILKAAASDANVIIYGESGTGKELVARAIHDTSDRNRRNFVPVNCGAIPEGLFESEFFGYKKGAFSGAHVAKKGYIDMAEGGTLFLDEVGEISLHMQVKLLRAIDQGGYTPLGGNEVLRPEIRIVAATNRDLKMFVQKGLMRKDFFYRIHIIPIHLPPLRERKEDLPLLIEHFLKKYDKQDHGELISGRVLEFMNRYEWPGNVRELQNVLHRYATLNRLDLVDTDAHEPEGRLPDFRGPIEEQADVPDFRTAVRRFEKALILKTLEQSRWHREAAAKRLGLPVRTFFRKLKALDISSA